jgi:hypothetical protein
MAAPGLDSCGFDVYTCIDVAIAIFNQIEVMGLAYQSPPPLYFTNAIS